MSLYHTFHLANLNTISHDEYWKTDEINHRISIYDDHLAYMTDTLVWIETYNPARKEPYKGLCWYGPTVIRAEGAEKASQVFRSWANLLELGPDELNLQGYLTRDDNNPDGYYDRMKILRDEIVLKLKTLASWADKIIESNGQYFIIHLGI